MSFGERLTYALSFAGRSRAQLARELGISVQAIAQVSTGSSKSLTAENTLRAARFLSVSAWWLATGEGTPVGIQALCETLSSEALAVAAEYESMTGPERERFRLLMQATKIERRISDWGDLDER